MTDQGEFFTPNEVDEQIASVSQLKQGEQVDIEALAYLQSLYGIDPQQEREALGRIWNRIGRATPALQVIEHESERGNVIHMHIPQSTYNNTTSRKRRASLAQRLGMLAAAVLVVILVGSLALVFYTVRHQPNSPGTGAPTPAPTSVHRSTPTSVPPTAAVSFKVTSVDMAVNPTSVAGIACGTNLTVTYTATFHVAPGSAGGVVQFAYTVNNGRGSTPASITFGKGETTKTYSFTWSGALPIDHTYPEPGGVIVSSPNAIHSPLLGPTGACSPSAFNVTGVTMSVTPASIAGLKCGTNLTVTYTATFRVAPDSGGGVVQFQYTVNNGRGTNPGSLTFSPGVTTLTYSFTWSGTLPADHTAPGQGGVVVTSPNSVNSGLFGPTGRCS